jgi:hypothetical protein
MLLNRLSRIFSDKCIGLHLFQELETPTTLAVCSCKNRTMWKRLRRRDAVATLDPEAADRVVALEFPAPI